MSWATWPEAGNCPGVGSGGEAMVTDITALYVLVGLLGIAVAILGVTRAS